MKYIILFSTAPSEKVAVKIAKGLLANELVACVNIIPKIRSLYKWKGRSYDEPEVIMVMKSKSMLLSKIKKELKRLHPYECPELVSLAIRDGLNEYLGWIDDSTIAR